VGEATFVATLTPPASAAGSQVTLVGEQDGEATDRALDLARTATGDAITVGPVVAPAHSAPGAPRLLKAVSYDAATRVSFAPPTSTGGSPVTGYEISLDGGQHWRPLRHNSANPISGAVAGLTNGRTYAVRIRAVNGIGPGPASGNIAVMPAGVPTAPRNATATATLTRVAVSWTPPATNGGSPVRYYLVTASPGGQTCSTRTNRCVFPQLRPATTYSFGVVAVNAVTVLRGTGTSPAARTTSLYVSTRPSVPRSLVVTPGDRVLTLSFQPPASNGGRTVTGYQVTRDRGLTWTRLPTTGTTRLRATIAPVLNGSAYILSVRAVNANGPSPATAGVAVRPPAWFFDPVSASDRSTQIDVPSDPAAYRGPLRATKAAYRSRNGSAAFPAALLGGRQLQPGQAVNFGGAALFAFDSGSLTPSGVAQVRAMTASLTYVSQITCEGYADYAGSRSREFELARQRAASICQLISAAARQVSSATVASYGPDRPVTVGGRTADRDANRRVVVLIRR
jgi:outer membrane protein OmpA-like peptidoglycan-associated protein